MVGVTTFLLEKELIWLILAGGLVYWLYKTKPKFSTANSFLLSFFLLQINFTTTQNDVLKQIGWFFFKAGAFVFGSGLAIVPFLYGGLPWMQAVFYGIGAAVIGIIAIGTYKLTKKSLNKDCML